MGFAVAIVYASTREDVLASAVLNNSLMGIPNAHAIRRMLSTDGFRVPRSMSAR
jgi:hypothetical protein